VLPVWQRGPVQWGWHRHTWPSVVSRHWPPFRQGLAPVHWSASEHLFAESTPTLYRQKSIHEHWFAKLTSTSILYCHKVILGYTWKVQNNNNNNIKWLFWLLRVCYKAKNISNLPTPILKSCYLKKKQKSYLKSRPAQLTDVAVWPSPAVDTRTLEAARCVSARSSIQTRVRRTLIHVYNSIWSQSKEKQF